jgi:hypothetical protein
MSALGRFCCDFRFADGQLELRDDAITTAGTQWRDFDVQVAGQPMVPVNFNGFSALALWDTGAAMTVVDVSIADAHPQLFVGARTTYGTDSSGVTFAARLAMMAPCEVGGVKFAASPCALADLGPMNAQLERPMSIILGAPLLIRAGWTFHFPHRRWQVRQPTTRRADHEAER